MPYHIKTTSALGSAIPTDGVEIILVTITGQMSMIKEKYMRINLTLMHKQQQQKQEP
tara:strand:+ start:267 stop:437 length:171 start_codon:yes stop_codon:yes gene_type:complete